MRYLTQKQVAERLTGKVHHLSVSQCVLGGGSFLWILCAAGPAVSCPLVREQDSMTIFTATAPRSLPACFESRLVLATRGSRTLANHALALHLYIVREAYPIHIADMSWLLLAVTST